MGRASQFIWYINQDAHLTHGTGSGFTRWKKDKITHFDPEKSNIKKARRKYRRSLKNG